MGASRRGHYFAAIRAHSLWRTRLHRARRTAVGKKQIDQKGGFGIVRIVEQGLKIFLHPYRCLDIIDAIPKGDKGLSKANVCCR